MITFLFIFFCGQKSWFFIYSYSTFSIQVWRLKIWHKLVRIINKWKNCGRQGNCQFYHILWSSSRCVVCVAALMAAELKLFHDDYTFHRQNTMPGWFQFLELYLENYIDSLFSTVKGEMIFLLQSVNQIKWLRVFPKRVKIQHYIPIFFTLAIKGYIRLP